MSMPELLSPTPPTTLTIGTRGSKLALTQTGLVAEALRRAHASLQVDTRVISTQGDRVLDVALSKIGDKGVFVKELESALLQHEIDLAVHSAKDLPSQLPEGLGLAAFLPRGDVRDVIVVKALPTNASSDADSTEVLDALPNGARVGTSSLRRMCQLRAARPDLALADVRGNVDSRLRKLLAGHYDALVLAGAGLERLGFISRAADGQPVKLDLTILQDSNAAALWAIPLPTACMLPAVAQGALALECRVDDAGTIARLVALNDPMTHAAALAERAFLRHLEGGCQAPIAALAEVEDGVLKLTGLVGTLDGTTVVRGTCAGVIDQPEALGVALAKQLLTEGADAVLGRRKPLDGKRIVLTRAEDRNAEMTTQLRALGAEPLIFPAIAYEAATDQAALRAAAQRLRAGDYDWLVLTSATAIQLNVELLSQVNSSVRLAAVGSATAEACLAQLHRPADVIPATYAASELVAAMQSHIPTLAGHRMLLLNADIAKPALQTQLEAAGAQVDRVVAYRTVRANPDDNTVPAWLATGEIDALTFTSGSTVTNFVEQIGPQLLDAARNILCVCIGPTTAEAAREFGFTHIVVAGAATKASLIDRLVEAFQPNLSRT